MELLYNPDRMPEAEIKATFVAREPLVDELFELVKGQPDGAGVQHAVIIAPRGMGKTTVLLMLKFAIKDRGLSDQWQAVKFPEESYGIYDLSDFWLEILSLIAADTSDVELDKLVKDLKIKYPKNDDLQEAAYAALKDWRRKHGKRLLLLVENFDQILEQINDERDNARLRDVLMNDGAVMLLGGATTFFKEARAYDQPLYNFFKIYNLADLKFAQIQDLLRQRSLNDGFADFEAKLKENAGRLRVLEYFTGGSPRLVLMLYRVVTQSDVGEVRRALEKLLDEVTPYYKAKVESLPPQQRKILDHIARVSGQTNEGLTPKEIAEAVRLSQNQVSAQLKRLVELDYVRAANLRGRSSWYTLSEPFYAIWHQMRFGRSARERMNWLVSFLKVWYSADEIDSNDKWLRLRFLELLNAGLESEAWGVFEYRLLLADAVKGTEVYAKTMARIGADGYRLMADWLEGIERDELPARIDQNFPVNSNTKDETWLLRGMLFGMKGMNDEALVNFDQALSFNPKYAPFWFARGGVLLLLERLDEAGESFDRAVEIEPNNVEVWKLRGSIFNQQGRYEDAVKVFQRAVEINDNDPEIREKLGRALIELKRYEEAINNYDRIYELKPDDKVHWSRKGYLLEITGRQVEAIDSYLAAIKSNPTNSTIWVALGMVLYRLKRRAEAIESWQTAQELNPKDEGASLCLRMVALEHFIIAITQKRLIEAKDYWEEAVTLSKRLKEQSWHEELSKVLLSVAEIVRPNFIRQLINESGLEILLFPLVRAIDYFQTGDEALIEKLSPEVRGIVEEVVAKLRTVVPSAQAADLPDGASSK